MAEVTSSESMANAIEPQSESMDNTTSEVKKATPFKKKKTTSKKTTSTTKGFSSAAVDSENVNVPLAANMGKPPEDGDEEEEKSSSQLPPEKSQLENPTKDTELVNKYPEENAVEKYVKEQLEMKVKTEDMLKLYGEKDGFSVFRHRYKCVKTSDDTNAFFEILRQDGTKESAKAVAEYLSIAKVKLDDDGNLSIDNPINLHLQVKEERPSRSCNHETPQFVNDKVKEIPAMRAELDCDDVCLLLKMFDGHVAVEILETLFVPVLLHDAGRSSRDGTIMEAILNSVNLIKTMKTGSRKSKAVLEQDWKNPIYSARMLPGEVRTYASENMDKLRAPFSWDGENNYFSCACGLFAKTGLRSLVPQSYNDRVVAGGDLFQLFWPFHERRKIRVSYGILNIHEDIGCVQSLVYNRNHEVFDKHECQAVIRHVLGDVNTMVYLNLLSNIIIVFLWVLYSREVREEMQKSAFFARCLLIAYCLRGFQIVLQIIGATYFAMRDRLVKSTFFWWQIFQTGASVICLITLWAQGTNLTNATRAVVSTIIGAQWWNALFALRIIRTLGECIMPIVSAMLRVNVMSFILISTFFTCGMAHALYTLGLHDFYDSLMLAYRLAILGDFDLAELDGTETGLQATENSNSFLTLDMAPYDFGYTEENKYFARLFVLVVGVMSTVLLMNVLIGVLSKNFEEAYDERTRSYWKSAGRIALQFAQQWEGFRQLVTMISCEKYKWEPVLWKVTKRRQKLIKEKGVPLEDIPEPKHLWFCTPHQSSEAANEDLQDKVNSLELKIDKILKKLENVPF